MLGVDIEDNEPIGRRAVDVSKVRHRNDDYVLTDVNLSRNARRAISDDPTQQVRHNRRSLVMIFDIQRYRVHVNVPIVDEDESISRNWK